MGPGSDTGGSGLSGLVVSNSVQNILDSFVRSFPCECRRHVIVITFILRNKHHSNIPIEIEELEGGVRATGLFCLLGIGIGLGSLFVYKLYTRLFPKARLPPSVSVKLSRPNSGCRHLVAGSGVRRAADKTLAETPDSGISAGTVAIHNEASHFRAGAPSNPGSRSIRRTVGDTAHLHRRQTTVAEWLACTELRTSTDLNFDTEDFSSDGNRRNLTKPLHSRRSSGYLSTDPAHGEGDDVELRAIRKHLYEQVPVCFTLDEDFAYDEVLSIADHVLVPSILSESPEDELSDPEAGNNLGFTEYETEQERRTIGKRSASPFRQRRFSAGNLLSPEVPRLWLRRDHRSCSSDLSSGSSGCTCRESLVSKGFSVDLGEDLAGMMTPPDGETGALNHWTMSSMDQLHKELKNIRKDIDCMTEKVVHLSKEDSIKLSVAPTSVDENYGMWRRGSKSRERSHSLSPSRTHRRSVDRNFVEGDVDSPDFIWDYHSDLALDKCDEPLFVVKRPHHVLSDEVQNQHLARSLESETAFDGAQSHGTLASRRRHSSMRDLFSFEGLEESFEDEFVFKNRLTKSSSPVDANVCPTSEDRRCSSSPDPDRASRSNQGLVCDHIASISGFCLSGSFCGQVGQSYVSSNAHCTCHKSVVFVHPHNPCPSCHGQQRDRAMSARTRQKSGQPLPSGHGIIGRFAADQSPPSRQSPPMVRRRCINVPVVQCRSLNGSAIQKRQSSDFCNDNSTEPCMLKPWLPVPETDFSDMINSTRSSVIGNKINLKDYLAKEFSCFDQHHQGIKKGYDLLHRLWGVTGIRRLYNDNYSCLRAVLYQTLMSNLTKLNKSGNFHCSVQKLAMIIDSGHSYLVNWSFGSLSLLPKEEVVMKMTDCLHTLFEQAAAVSEMSSVTCREQYLLAMLNHSPEMDQSLLEGLKILMMLKAVELFEDYSCGKKNVLSFVLQLFAKESSNSLEYFFNNHINVIGNTVPMKDVEMCLLGLTLDVRIEVMRPYCFNREGFVVHFPDEGADEFQKVHIIEEDQNYFCIPTMKYLS